MPSNAEAAEIFQSIADLLDVLGEKFKPDAYRRAARSIESLTEDLGAIAGRNELRSVPGVGDAIEEKIREYLATGHITYYDKLQQQIPAGVVELLKIPGLGPKTARRFWIELGVEGPAELTAALDAGRLDGVKGFGPKKVAQIRAAVEAFRANANAGARMPIQDAYPIAMALVRGLRQGARAEQVEVAGSFRRGRETVGDLDILVTSVEPERAFDVFSALPQVQEVRLRGGTKETVLLRNGLQVDLRVVEPASFGAALVYFTGSKDHNVQIRSLAKDRGLRVNEYGVTRGEERLAGRTEEDVYRSLGLAWVPPEIREARGEIEAAARGPLPRLVDTPDLRGDLHVHLPADAGPVEVDRLAAAAKAQHLAYLGVVTHGVDAVGDAFELPAAVRTRLAELSTPSLRLARVWEGDGGASAPPVDAAWEIVRPSARHRAPPSATRPNHRIALVAHGPADPADATAWLAFAHSAGAAVEVGPGPERLDSNGARRAREAHVLLGVPTGVGTAEDDPTGPIGLRFARRAGAVPSDVRNSAAQPPFSGASKRGRS